MHSQCIVAVCLKNAGIILSVKAADIMEGGTADSLFTLATCQAAVASAVSIIVVLLFLKPI